MTGGTFVQVLEVLCSSAQFFPLQVRFVLLWNIWLLCADQGAVSLSETLNVDQSATESSPQRIPFVLFVLLLLNPSFHLVDLGLFVCVAEADKQPAKGRLKFLQGVSSVFRASGGWIQMLKQTGLEETAADWWQQIEDGRASRDLWICQSRQEQRGINHNDHRTWRMRSGGLVCPHRRCQAWWRTPPPAAWAEPGRQAQTCELNTGEHGVGGELTDRVQTSYRCEPHGLRNGGDLAFADHLLFPLSSGIRSLKASLQPCDI